jgi:hypothetical protein
MPAPPSPPPPPPSPYYTCADITLFKRYADATANKLDRADAAGTGTKRYGEAARGTLHEEASRIGIGALPRGTGGSSLRMVGRGRIERDVVTWYRVGDTETHAESSDGGNA